MSWEWFVTVMLSAILADKHAWKCNEGWEFHNSRCYKIVDHDPRPTSWYTKSTCHKRQAEIFKPTNFHAMMQDEKRKYIIASLKSEFTHINKMANNKHKPYVWIGVRYHVSAVPWYVWGNPTDDNGGFKTDVAKFGEWTGQIPGIIYTKHDGVDKLCGAIDTSSSEPFYIALQNCDKSYPALCVKAMNKRPPKTTTKQPRTRKRTEVVEFTKAKTTEPGPGTPGTEKPKKPETGTTATKGKPGESLETGASDGFTVPKSSPEENENGAEKSTSKPGLETKHWVLIGAGIIVFLLLVACVFMLVLSKKSKPQQQKKARDSEAIEENVTQEEKEETKEKGEENDDNDENSSEDSE